MTGCHRLPTRRRRPDPAPWEGTATELLDTLRRLCAEARMPTADLPEDVRTVGLQVREIAPSLRKAGVDIRASRTGKRRTLRIRKITDPGQDPPAPSLSEEENTRH